MNKTELIAAVAEQTGLSKKDAEKASLAPQYSAFTRGIMRGLVEAEIDEKDLGELLFAIAHAAKQLGYEPDIDLIKYTDKLNNDISYKESKSNS